MEKILEKIKNEKGISLVELVVAVAVFSLVVTVASGIFINAMKAQKEIMAKQSIADDLRYDADFMLKELRMAQANPSDATLTFSDGAGNPLNANTSPPSSVIYFFNSSGNNIAYSLVGSNIMREDISNATGAQSISSGAVEITSLSFILNNWNLTKGAPGAASPLITVLITARAKSGVGGDIELQTSVSPRIY